MDNGLSTKRDIWRAALVLLGAIAQIAAAAAPTMLGWGQTIGERSAAFETVLTPAGYAFIIWAVIFGGSLIFAVYQALPQQWANLALRRAGWPIALGFWGNAAFCLYVPQFGTKIGSLVIIVIITFGAVVGVWRASRTARSTLSRAMFSPISLFAGWVSIATGVAVSLTTAQMGWNPLGLDAQTSALVILVTFSVLATFVAIAVRSWIYASAVVWGLVAINRANVPDGNELIATVALALAGLVALGGLAGALAGRR